MRLRIDATRSPFWYALLEITAAGVQVQIWKQLRADGTNNFMCRLEGTTTYDAPLHVVRDQVLDLLNGLAPPTANS